MDAPGMINAQDGAVACVFDVRLLCLFYQSSVRYLDSTITYLCYDSEIKQ